MPTLPGGRAVRLFAAPLAAYAAALAEPVYADTPIEAAMWRVLMMSAALVAVIHVAARMDNERGGRWAVIAGTALAAMTAGALSFAAALGCLFLTARSFDPLIMIAAVFFAAFLAGTTAFLVYINSVTTGVAARSVAVATVLQCITLTALMLNPYRPAAIAVAVAATVMCAISFVHDRRSTKNRPSS